MLETYGGSALSKVRRVLRGNLWGMVTAILVASLLALPPEAAAQAPVTPSPGGQPPQAPNLAPQTPAPLPVESLAIYVLEGQNEMHDVRNRVTATPVVEVRDDNGQPIEGAEVTFELPPMGPSGTFAGQALTYTAKTNTQGQVAASFQPN